MKKILLLTGILGIVIMQKAHAQSATLEGFKSINKNTISPIFEGNEVKGYILYYKTDKADSKNDNYGLDFYDENLDKVKGLAMKKPRDKYFLISNAFNGEAFGLYFYNTDDVEFQMNSYNSGLEKIGTTKIEEPTKGDIRTVKENLRKNDNNIVTVTEMSLRAVPNKGFLRNGISESNKGYSLDMYDSKMKHLWHFETPEKSPDYESLAIYDVSERYICACCVRRPNKLSHNMFFYVVIFDVETGKKIIDIDPSEKDDKELSMNGLGYDDQKEEFFVTGDYYSPGDKPGVDKSLGIYLKKLDLEGNITNQKFFAWDKEIAKMMSPEARKSLMDGYMNFTHKIVRAGDKVYIITEQYKTGADVVGIVGNVLGGGYGNSMTKGVLGGMMIFAISDALKITKIAYVPKEKLSITLPPGADFYGKGMIGLAIKYFGGFDYEFTQMSNDGKTFNVVYYSRDREEGEKAKKIMGNIMLTESGEIKTDKIDISSKATSSFIYPGKPGYVMMVDFLKKQKQLGMKLIKLND